MGCDIAIGAFAGEAGVPVFARSFSPGRCLVCRCRCRRWQDSTRSMLRFHRREGDQHGGGLPSVARQRSVVGRRTYLTRYSDVRSERTSSVECPADVVLLPSPIPIGSIGGCPAGFIPNYLLVNSYINNAGGSAHAASSFPRIGG